MELERGSAGGAWVPIETLAAPEDVLVWAADQLQAAASGEGSRIRAVAHRVVVSTPARSRLSLLYELRAPATIAAFSYCRHGRSRESCHVCQMYPIA